MDINEKYNRLIQSLQLIASDYDQQVSCLPDYVAVADEIALTYEEVLYNLETLVEHSIFNETQAKELKNIDAIFDEFGKDKTLWDLQALKESPEWEKLRHLASDVLTSLGIKKEKPDLYWSFYIPDKEEGQPGFLKWIYKLFGKVNR